MAATVAARDPDLFHAPWVHDEEDAATLCERIAPVVHARLGELVSSVETLIRLGSKQVADTLSPWDRSRFDDILRRCDVTRVLHAAFPSCRPLMQWSPDGRRLTAMSQVLAQALEMVSSYQATPEYHLATQDVSSHGDWSLLDAGYFQTVWQNIKRIVCHAMKQHATASMPWKDALGVAAAPEPEPESESKSACGGPRCHACGVSIAPKEWPFVYLHGVGLWARRVALAADIPVSWSEEELTDMIMAYLSFSGNTVMPAPVTWSKAPRGSHLFAEAAPETNHAGIFQFEETPRVAFTEWAAPAGRLPSGAFMVCEACGRRDLVPLDGEGALEILLSRRKGPLWPHECWYRDDAWAAAAAKMQEHLRSCGLFRRDAETGAWVPDVAAAARQLPNVMKIATKAATLLLQIHSALQELAAQGFSFNTAELGFGAPWQMWVVSVAARLQGYRRVYKHSNMYMGNERVMARNLVRGSCRRFHSAILPTAEYLTNGSALDLRMRQILGTVRLHGGEVDHRVDMDRVINAARPACRGARHCTLLPCGCSVFVPHVSLLAHLQCGRKEEERLTSRMYFLALEQFIRLSSMGTSMAWALRNYEQVLSCLPFAAVTPKNFQAAAKRLLMTPGASFRPCFRHTARIGCVVPSLQPARAFPNTWETPDDAIATWTERLARTQGDRTGDSVDPGWRWPLSSRGPQVFWKHCSLCHGNLNWLEALNSPLRGFELVERAPAPLTEETKEEPDSLEDPEAPVEIVLPDAQQTAALLLAQAQERPRQAISFAEVAADMRGLPCTMRLLSRHSVRAEGIGITNPGRARELLPPAGFLCKRCFHALKKDPSLASTDPEALRRQLGRDYVAQRDRSSQKAQDFPSVLERLFRSHFGLDSE
jgi:hypothetical protein